MNIHFDWALLLPEMVLCGGGVVLLLLDAIAPSMRRAFTPIAVLVAVAAGYAAWYATPLGNAVMTDPARTFNGQIESSALTFAFSLVVLLATVLCLLASQGYLRRERILSGEYHALLLWCAAGLLLMLRATELLTIFLALETLSLCLYSLAAFHRRIALSGEAAIKYFLMGAFVSAFVLYGIALVYGATGSTRLDEIGRALAAAPSVPVLASLGILFLVAGFGFKMALVPFHAWSPDTYQGAPSPFVAFLSVAPKVASALVLYRLLDAIAQGGAAPYAAKWSTVVAVLSVLSMVVGNLLALVQRDLKRMLAYSGVAHMGYLLLALVTLDRASLMPVLVYLLAYALMNAGAFAVVSMLYNRPGEQHLVSDLAGWGYRYPLLGACLAVCMLSLGGIPPTVGFLGKYVVFLNAVADGHVGLAITGVLASLVGVFYYLRVVYYLYMKPETRQPEGLLIDVWGRTAAVLAALGTLALGIWPTDLLQWLIAATALR
ncbi:MAG TPA: NADH-quinone oxidoreductase subunit N [Thermoanaerobaculia bacterium]|nr:NADH-quinone oxidoreductase subunit N [Thermoanaerobaculia bacterium]